MHGWLKRKQENAGGNATYNSDGKQIFTRAAYETLRITALVLNSNAELWNKNLIFDIGTLLF